jgi:hypothetical protein
MPPWMKAPWTRAPWDSGGRLVGIDQLELAADLSVPTPPLTPPLGPLPNPGPDWEQRIVSSTGVAVWSYPARNSDQALAVWQDWRDAHPSTGWWPILVDPDFWSSVEQPGPAAADFALTGAEWLARRLYGGTQPLAERIPRGPFVWRSPGGARSRRRQTNYLGATEVVLVPASAGWLVPEILGWNGAAKVGVYGPQHTLVLRRWAAQWGAEPQGLGSDELVLRVNRPPATKDEAWYAAVELVTYSPELARADQDSTLEDVAATVSDPTWDIIFDLDDDEDDGEYEEGD